MPLKHQHGLALLVMVIAIALSVIAYFVSSLSIDEVRADRELKTQQALKQAKEVLIAYAVTYADKAGNEGHYGFLPCPDHIDNGIDTLEGAEDDNCDPKNVNVIGLFPWRSLETGSLKSSSGECMRYAISGMYKNHGEPDKKTDMLNEDSQGYFVTRDSSNNIIQGSQPHTRPVALIFAPGPALPGQSRNNDPDYVCGDDYDLTHFLDDTGGIDNSGVSSDPDTIDEFKHSGPGTDELGTPYNDKFITISREEIWSVIVDRRDWKNKMEYLTEALARCLADYANLGDNTSRRLPWPVVVGLNGNDYWDNDSYDDNTDATPGYAGRFPFKITDSNAAIGMTPGDVLFDAASCTAVPTTGGNVNLVAAGSEYRKLWNHWKDHFFYAVSNVYGPGDTDDNECGGPGTCITVDGELRAGVVIFSGSRLPGATRNDKSDISEYLEDDKAAVFPDATGSGTYNYTDPQTDEENDVMYCIQNVAIDNDLTVIEC